MNKNAWTAGVLTVLTATTVAAGGQSLPYMVVKTAPFAGSRGFDGRVEAVRQTQIAPQVGGTVARLGAHAGDRVRASQLLVALDGSAARQNAAASAAQTKAAQAVLAQAQNNVARKKQLFAKGYISKAAMEAAQTEYRSALEQVKALGAQTSAAQTQSGFYTLSAPYAGVVAESSAQLGQTAMPGMPLMTLYDPSALRVSANVPVSALSSGVEGKVKVEIGIGAKTVSLQPVSVQVLPAVDARTMSREVRAQLPDGQDGSIVPGMFARLVLPDAADGTAVGAPSMTIPQKALVRRAEMTGVYVLNAKNQPLLRQVRVGTVEGARVQILSGLDSGDKVIVNPALATRRSRQAGGKE